MAAPWEKYQSAGPWSKYASQESPVPSAIETMADMSSSVQNAVIPPLAKAGDVAARGFSKFAFGTEAPVDVAQAGLQKLGEGIQKAEGATAEYLGSKGMNPYVAAAVPLVAETAASALIPGGTSTLGLKGLANTAARRSLGMKKGVMKKLYGGVERADQVGKEMLDRGVISPFASSETMIDRAEAISKTGSQKMNQGLAMVEGKPAMDATQMASDIVDSLKEKTKGLKEGAFKADESTINEIADTITAAGPDKTPFELAQTIKEKLQEKGKFNIGANADDNAKASLFRKASGQYREALDRELEATDPKASTIYKEGKKEFGLAEDALKGLKDEYFAEAGNKLPTLRGTGLAAGAMAKLGIPGSALVGIISEYLLRKGAQMSAYTAGKALPNTVGSAAARNATLTQLLGNQYRGINENR